MTWPYCREWTTRRRMSSWWSTRHRRPSKCSTNWHFSSLALRSMFLLLLRQAGECCVHARQIVMDDFRVVLEKCSCQDIKFGLRVWWWRKGLDSKQKSELSSISLILRKISLIWILAFTFQECPGRWCRISAGKAVSSTSDRSSHGSFYVWDLEKLLDL